MKGLQHYYWNLLSAAALFGMVALFLADPGVADETAESRNQTADASVTAMSAEERSEFEASLVEGYRIPEELYPIFEPIPESYAIRLRPAPKDHIYRYLDGIVYTVDPKTRVIRSVLVMDE